MKTLRLFICVFTLLAFGPRLEAQGGFTTVTGTVTDPNGVKWACGTISAQLITAGGAAPTLNGGAFTTVTSPVGLGCPTSPGTGAPGSFRMLLADSGVIQPSNTTWKFTVGTAGNAPPLGTGPQSFSFTTAINCSTNTPSICTANSMDISSQLSALAPALGGGGGASSPVSSLPATCTPGVTGNVTLTAGPSTVQQEYQCGPQANTWFPFNPTLVVNPISYGAKSDVRFVYDASFVSGSGTITCPNSSCNFTSADVGKIVIGYKGPNQANIGTSLYTDLVTCATAPCPTIGTVNSANSITLAAGATSAATCTPAAADNFICTLAWGTADDTTAINNAITAAWSTNTACLPVQFTGPMFFSGPIVNLTLSQLSSACGGQQSTISGGVDTGQSGPTLFSLGSKSPLIPLPYYNFAGCTFGESGHGCNFTTPNLYIHDVAIDGIAQGTSSSATVNLVELIGSRGGFGCTGSTGVNLWFANWAVKNVNATGIDLGRFACGDPAYWNITSELFGGTNCQLNSPGGGITTSVMAIQCFGASIQPLIVSTSLHAGNNPAIINTTNSFFGLTFGVTTVVKVTGNGVWNSKGDNFLESTTAGQSAADVLTWACTACTTNFDGDTFELDAFGSTSQTFLTLGNTAAIAHFRNSYFGSAGANNRDIDHTAGTLAFFDDGGNTWAHGTLASSFTGGTFSFIAEGHSVKGICTGTATSSSTLALNITGISLTGTGITTACTGTTLDKGTPAQGARTLSTLACTSSATTVSVTCTVMVSHNGGAFAATALTCTMTAATACTDFVHTAAIADGDLVSLEIVTGAAETGANIKATAGWN